MSTHLKSEEINSVYLSAALPGQGTKQGCSISCWILFISFSPQSSSCTGWGGDSGQSPQWTTHDRFRLWSPSPHSAPCTDAHTCMTVVRFTNRGSLTISKAKKALQKHVFDLGGCYEHIDRMMMKPSEASWLFLLCGIRMTNNWFTLDSIHLYKFMELFFKKISRI